jgi:phenylacetate-CoA ligase
LQSGAEHRQLRETNEIIETAMLTKTALKIMPKGIELLLRRAYGTIPPVIRYGKAYRDTMSLLEKSQWWSRERLRDYQEARLKLLVEHSYANAPYYRKIFDRQGIEPGDISSINDLEKLPCLTRELVRENIDELVARNYPASRLQRETTGGSSGTPMGLYFERNHTDGVERAFIHTAWKRVGFKPSDRLVVLRGKVVGPNKRGQFWEYSGSERSLFLSSYHMADDNLSRYVAKIRRFRPAFIFGYPSAVLLLAQYMNRNSIEPFETVKAVLCGSENLYPNLRAALGEAFKCRIFSWYGHTERAALAAECELQTHYHIFPEYGIVELLDANGREVESPGKIGEVVATSLINFAFPLIRYRTGDLASFSSTTCGCGRNYPLLEKVEGRSQEFIVTKDGRAITLTALIFSQHFSAFSKIRLMQIEQRLKGEIKVKIVRAPEYSAADEDEIRNVILKSVSGDVDIGFEYADDIARTRSGKHRFLVQHLALDQGGRHE